MAPLVTGRNAPDGASRETKPNNTTGGNNTVTAAEKRISAFCARHRLSYEWQSLKYNGRRAFVESADRSQHAAALAAARRLKGVRVSDWTCGAGGVWEGRIYLQDAADASRMEEAAKIEWEHLENWWAANHNARLSGLEPDAAAQYAESLYPTPATA